MPSPSTIRRIALDDIAGGTPGPDAAWAEVQHALGTHGRARTPTWSTPIIDDTIATLGGWRRLCDSTDLTGARIGFTRAYRRNTNEPNATRSHHRDSEPS